MGKIERDILYKTLGMKIKYLRTNAEMSQEGLGKRVDLSRPSIVNIESGRQHPSVHLLLEFSRIFNYDLLNFVRKEFWDAEKKLDDQVSTTRILGKLDKDAEISISHFIQSLKD